MRTKRSLLVSLFAVLALFAIVPSGAAVAGDPTTEARGHYSEGQRLFSKKDFQGAIREFAAAEKIVPSGYNDYNLALCYDKLGEADPAIQYYQSYLQRVPDAANRAAVDASVARLSAALKSAAMKAEAAAKADQARKDAAARKGAEAAAEAAAKAEAAAAKVEQARLEVEARKAADAATANPVPPPLPTPTVGPTATLPPVATNPVQPILAGPAPTGDPQLDRIASIDIGAIRAQRGTLGMAPVGGTMAQPAAGGGNGVPSPAAAAAASNQVGDRPAKTASTPIYQKWWFWAIVLVGGYIVYDFATTDSATPVRASSPTPNNAGMPLLRF
ncbi:MAG: hypothetical protein KBG15_10025 [Kofleriaceae bacterium]|nr:hypothetical protein [Kofleriaceae bacterium]